jgi:putative transposase
MKFDPDIHHRRSVRLGWYDYSGAGAYFVTICVHGRECLFGEVADGSMRLNPAGEIVRVAWDGLPERFPNVTMDIFMIMPNHFHGIIIINDVGAPLAAPGFESELQGRDAASSAEDKGAASDAPTLGKIMRTFKSISAINVNRLLDRQDRPLWQRNYYERVIRSERELAGIREYILNNSMKWEQDEENPVNVPGPTGIVSQ